MRPPALLLLAVLSSASATDARAQSVSARTAATLSFYESHDILKMMVGPEPFGRYTFHTTFDVCDHHHDTESAAAPVDETEYLFRMADLRPGDAVVDFGCGVGGTMMALAQRPGTPRLASITGINPSVQQLAEAEAEARRRGLMHHPVHDDDGDDDLPSKGTPDNTSPADDTTGPSAAPLRFLHVWPGGDRPLPLEDGSVDVILAQESPCQVHTKEHLFEEFFRVLRPGGRLVSMDWHAQVRVEPLTSGIDAAWRTSVESSSHYLELARRAGFGGGGGGADDPYLEYRDGLALSCDGKRSILQRFEADSPLLEALTNGSFAVGFVKAVKVVAADGGGRTKDEL